MMQYGILAQIYDRVMTRVDYRAWAAFLWEAHSRLALPSPSAILDLAAGTGGATVELAKGGASILALDQSPQMLAILEQKAKEAGLANQIKTQAIDLAHWSGGGDFELAISLCDGLNYLDFETLSALFSKVHSSLRPDSLFIFDLSTPYKYQEVYDCNVYAEDFPEFAYIWENQFQGATCDFFLTIFLQEGQHYQKYQEQHTQFVHQLEKIADSLTDAGFIWRGVFDSYSWEAPKEDCLRWTIIAQS